MNLSRQKPVALPESTPHERWIPATFTFQAHGKHSPGTQQL
jgi:hypothetical protein